MRKAEKQAVKLIKPPVKTERVSLDDFEVEVDGESYHPHLNEWVDVLPVRRLSELKNLMELANFQATDEDGKPLSIIDPLLMKQYDGLCRYLSDSIRKWNLTDDEGEDYPQPYRRPDVIATLSVEEINYLVSKLIGGRTDDSKNELPDSPAT